MTKKPVKTQKQFLTENEELRMRLDEAEEILRAIRSGEVDALVVSGADGEQILTFKQVEEALRLSEEKYRSLVDEVNDGFYVMDIAGVFTFANPALARIYGVESPQVLVGRKFLEFIAPEILEELGEIHRNAMQSGRSPEIINGQIVRPDGTRAFIEIKPASIIKGDQVAGIRGVVRDITERKQAEIDLRRSEAMLQEAQHLAHIGNWYWDLATNQLSWSKEAFQIFGVDPQTFSVTVENFEKTIHPDDLASFLKTREQMLAKEMNAEIEHRIVKPDGEVRHVVERTRIGRDSAGGAVYMVGTVQDITERKEQEGKILAAQVKTDQMLEEANQSRRALLSLVEDQRLAEEKLVTSEARLRALFASMQDVVLVIDREGVYREVAPTNPGLLVQPPEELLGKNLRDIFPAGQAKSFIEATRQVLESRQTTRIEYELLMGGQSIWFATAISPMDEERTLWVAHDITESKQAEEKIRRQLEHLTALSAIDRIISTVFDLKTNLSEILSHVTKELGVDAADILVFNPGSLMLEYGAENGFRTETIRKAQVGLGESYAGRTALERQLIHIPNLIDEPDDHLLTDYLAGEDFVCYYGLPLIAKGEVKGVLEVFHRAVLEPDVEWFDFLNTLAGQVALAIENVTLFESLLRSNLDLNLAYDATIEGWSHALDLRDKETEGHTQRVTRMTMKLTAAFGLSEAEREQARWGALLHDIGKMGVPDGILLKPGSLTDEEWVVMRKHPTLAYEMLAPIHYLRMALDIPYCHHEKWDGSGYPRGLKGEQIPLIARIFAIVDVYDALTSDRPYRKAWSKEEATAHIKSGSGTHFDPQVVKAFFAESGDQ